MLALNGGRLPESLLFPRSLRIRRKHVLYTLLPPCSLARQAVSGPVLIGPRMRPSAASSSEVKTAADGWTDDPSDRRATGCERPFVISTRRWQVDCVRRGARTRPPTLGLRFQGSPIAGRETKRKHETTHFCRHPLFPAASAGRQKYCMNEFENLRMRV